MSTPNPPILDGSPVINIDFELADQGGAKGDYEMFVDITRSTTIVFTAPEGYSVKENGIRLYLVTKSGSGKVIPNSDKKKDIGKLQAGKYSDVFTGELPEDFHFAVSDDGSGTLRDDDGIQGEYEYLVWIATPDGSDSFADPGVRNR